MSSGQKERYLGLTCGKLRINQRELGKKMAKKKGQHLLK